MGCVFSSVLVCFHLCAPNAMASMEISTSIFKNLYKEYFRRFKEKFSLDTIYFSDSDVHEDLKTLLSKKLAVEFNELKIKKYSFWNGYAIDYISVQLAYYIFAKVMNTDYQFRIKDTKMKICMYEIPEETFDFTKEHITEFKKSFFCKTDGTLIDIEKETNEAIHEALKTKLTLKLKTIIESIDFSQIIPLIVQSYQKILNDKKNQETDAFDSILPIASE
tara:strand:- start:124 stop:783 length:660 start_codon:yes stop_codon:yes gene_type:complete